MSKSLATAPAVWRLSLLEQNASPRADVGRDHDRRRGRKAEGVEAGDDDRRYRQRQREEDRLVRDEGPVRESQEPRGDGNDEIVRRAIGESLRGRLGRLRPTLMFRTLDRIERQAPMWKTLEPTGQRAC